METVLLIVAGSAIVLAIVIAIKNKVKSPEKTEKPVGSTYFGPMAASPKPAKARSQRRNNKKGWRAPVGHYFDDDDQLYTDAGDLILDTMMVAQLCGERYDAPVEEIVEPAPAEESAMGAGVEAVGSETIASRPGESEIAASKTRQESYSAPEPSGYGGDSCDSGGSDSDSGGDD